MSREPRITINGSELTDEQAMTVRVAIESLRWSMHALDALGNDEHAKTMRALYIARGEEVSTMLLEPSDRCRAVWRRGVAPSWDSPPDGKRCILAPHPTTVEHRFKP